MPKRITRCSSSEVKRQVAELSSDQGADTKMFITANFVFSLGWISVTIMPVDSNVTVLACYHTPLLAKPLYINIGTGKYERMFDIYLQIDKTYVTFLKLLTNFPYL